LPTRATAGVAGWLPLGPCRLGCRARYARGVTPVTRRNTVEKWLAVRNPTALARSARWTAPRAASNMTARSIRVRTTNWCGGTRCCAGRGAREVVGAHVNDGPELREREGLIEMHADMVRHPPEPRQGRVPRVCPGRRRPSRGAARHDLSTRAHRCSNPSSASSSSSCPFRSSGARLSRGARPRVRAWRSARRRAEHCC
jgi:hypothetical protein